MKPHAGARWLTGALASALVGCATAQVAVPPMEASRLERTLQGQRRFLRVSLYVTPFFGDNTKVLVTAVPPDELDLVRTASGEPINPGEPQAVLPAGTAVRVRQLEFPSVAVMAQRVLYTPRTLAWLVLDMPGSPSGGRPGVLVLRPGLSSGADVMAELERYLTEEDPTPAFESWSEAVRTAVRTKTAVPSMPASALEAAWGYPEQKRIDFIDGQRKETWRWPRRRSAELVDGLVTALGEQPPRRSSAGAPH